VIFQGTVALVKTLYAFCLKKSPIFALQQEMIYNMWSVVIISGCLYSTLKQWW